jgi:hypothetical protein
MKYIAIDANFILDGLAGMWRQLSIVSSSLTRAIYRPW